MPQLQRISKNNTKVYEQEWGYEVWLHKTCIVTVRGTMITLNTGGWRTVTTATRMNQVANERRLGYHVSFRQGGFYVSYLNVDGVWIKEDVTGDSFTFRKYLGGVL